MPDSQAIAGKVTLHIQKKEIPAEWNGRYTVDRSATGLFGIDFKGDLKLLDGAMPVNLRLTDEHLPASQVHREARVRLPIEEALQHLLDSAG